MLKTAAGLRMPDGAGLTACDQAVGGGGSDWLNVQLEFAGSDVFRSTPEPSPRYDVIGSPTKFESPSPRATGGLDEAFTLGKSCPGML